MAPINQGQQLRLDLNIIIARGKNWNIPVFWAPLLRFISAPVLAIIYGFSYPGFHQLRDDPLHILGFAVAHFALVLIGLGIIVPRWFNILIPAHRREDGKIPYAPNVVLGTIDSEQAESMEGGVAGSKAGTEVEAETEIKAEAKTETNTETMTNESTA